MIQFLNDFLTLLTYASIFVLGCFILLFIFFCLVYKKGKQNVLNDPTLPHIVKRYFEDEYPDDYHHKSICNEDEEYNCQFNKLVSSYSDNENKKSVIQVAIEKLV